MTPDVEDSGRISPRTRRNIMRMGVIVGSVVLAKTVASACPPALCSAKCFLKGTKIETADGERKVEDLKIGELLPTMFGGTRPIQWIGRYSIKKSNPAKPWVESARPVRIAPSALSPGVPHSPLYVTGHHSLLIDGVLAPAEILINGATITRYEAREYDELEYFHIKLASHDVIYAEGAPAETLLEVNESAVNFVDYLRRYGTPTAEEPRCAPLIPVGGRDELKSRFRSALSPWIDLRDQPDVIRDRLEEQGSRSRQPASLDARPD